MNSIDEVDIVQRIYVPVPPASAFDAFVIGFNEWWPATYSFAGDSLAQIAIEPWIGGRCYERDLEGNELVWGEVLDVERSERIIFSWWIGPDRNIDPEPERASEVAVTFAAEDAGTRVNLVHRKLDHHGGDWQAMRDAMGSDHGWPMLLRLFAASVVVEE